MYPIPQTCHQKEKALKEIFYFFSDEHGNGLFEKETDLNKLKDSIVAKLYQAVLDDEELKTKVSLNYCFNCGTKLNGG